MNPGQGFLAGTGFDQQPQQQNPQQAQQGITSLVNLAAPQNTPPVCTGVSVPSRITVTNRFGEPREVVVYFHLPAQNPAQLKAAIETLLAMGFNIPAQRPYERGGYQQRGNHDHGYQDGPRQFRPYQSGY